MCFSIYLSTDCPDDLEALSFEHFSFLKDLGNFHLEILPLLAFPNKWFLTSEYGGCSCHFRHLGSGSDFWFGPVEDWCPEDEDDVARTKQIYEFLSELVRKGYGFDLIDVWSEAMPDDIKTVEVSLSAVPPDCFRFFENHRMILLE